MSSELRSTGRRRFVLLLSSAGSRRSLSPLVGLLRSGAARRRPPTPHRRFRGHQILAVAGPGQCRCGQLRTQCADRRGGDGTGLGSEHGRQGNTPVPSTLGAFDPTEVCPCQRADGPCCGFLTHGSKGNEHNLRVLSPSGQHETAGASTDNTQRLVQLEEPSSRPQVDRRSLDLVSIVELELLSRC